MRVLIWIDMEGTSGVIKLAQVFGGGKLHMEGRHLYTADVNAAVRGAKAAGADSIVVREFHGGDPPYHLFNVIVEDLDPDCEYIAHHVSGTEPLFTEQVDAAILLGWHAMAGTADGILAHTIAGPWPGMTLNGEPVGEIGLLAGLCGKAGVPVVTVTGDTAACREAHALLGDQVTTVAVKTGYAHEAGRIIPPKRARQMIEDGVKRGLENLTNCTPYVPDEPSRLEIEFNTEEIVPGYEGKPGVTVLSPTKVAIENDDYLRVFQGIFGLWNYDE